MKSSKNDDKPRLASPCGILSPGRQRRGLSLAEVSVCTLLVAMVMVGALNSLAMAIEGRTTIIDRERGLQRANSLMTEVLAMQYVADGALPSFGPELGEPILVPGSRSQYDDVDDLNGRDESPPQTSDGASLGPEWTGWSQAIEVQWVAPAAPTNTSLTDQKLKRVTVSVYRGAALMGRVVALKAPDAWTTPP